MDKLDIKETPSMIPQPVPPVSDIDISVVEDMYNKFYEINDELNKPAYIQGKLLEKDKTAGHIRVLKNIIHLTLDDLKTGSDTPEAIKMYEKVTNAILQLIDLIDTGPSNVKDNKRMVAKLFGYIFSLHNLHNL